MNLELTIWSTHPRRDVAEANEVFGRIRAGEDPQLESNPELEAFYRELKSRFAQLQRDERERELLTHELERGSGWVRLRGSWRSAELIRQTVEVLADAHGLAVFDPERQSIWYPLRTKRRVSGEPEGFGEWLRAHASMLMTLATAALGLWVAIGSLWLGIREEGGPATAAWVLLCDTLMLGAILGGTWRGYVRVTPSFWGAFAVWSLVPSACVVLMALAPLGLTAGLLPLIACAIFAIKSLPAVLSFGFLEHPPIVLAMLFLTPVRWAALIQLLTLIL